MDFYRYLQMDTNMDILNMDGADLNFVSPATAMN